MRIVIVEDEVMIRVGMGKLIENELGHQVIGEAKNGKDGLELIMRYKPDLVITDIRMPEMDGLAMMTELRKRNMQTKAVILTGYAEFEYAKRAIELGVTEYLLKPIGVDDVRQVLNKIEIAMEQESKKQKGPETLLRDIYLAENQENDTELVNELAELCFPAKETQQYSLYVGYVGAADANYKNESFFKIKQIAEQNRNLYVITVAIDKLQEVVCFVQGEFSARAEFQESLERKVLRHTIEPVIWSVVSFDTLSHIYEKMQLLQNLMSYGFVVGRKELITEERVQSYQVEEFVYPMELENELKSSICNGKVEKLDADKNAFVSYMGEHSYLPQDIRHGYFRFLTFISNLLQEIDKKTFEQMQNLCFMKQIGDARTLSELEGVLGDVITLLQNTQEKKEDIRNYTIKRAINYIREHFQEGISLEETAEKLDITPEYLSTLFYKEMEINFSTFIKEFRISQAKRLLKGTDMKIYEIAEAVGYHDAKYFMRVFKEVQGISPKEYRLRL